MEGTGRVHPVGQHDSEIAATLPQRFFAEEGFATPPNLIRARLALMLADETSAVFLHRWRQGEPWLT